MRSNPRSLLLLPLVLLVLACLAAGVGVATANAAAIVVDSTADGEDRLVGDGVCRTFDGGCTLRAAIQTANDDATPDTITFVTAPGQPIVPARALPEIRRPLEIDALTVDGRPAVELDGSELEPIVEQPPPGSFWVRGPHGLHVRGTTGVTIRGLVINSFPGAQIQLTDADDVVIRGNWLGVDATGRFDRGPDVQGDVDSAGIVATGVEQARIGGILTSDGNVVSGLEHGIIVEGDSAFVDVIGNRVGLSADGDRPIGNDDDGISVLRQPSRGRPSHVMLTDNAVAATGHGSNPAGAGTAIRVNSADDTRVTANWVGFDEPGELVRTALGTTFGNVGDGIQVVNAARTEVARNRVAAGSADGIAAGGAGIDGLRLTGNVVGLDGQGASGADRQGNPTGNARVGIWVSGGEEVEIGGAAAGQGNVVAGNRGGVVVAGDVERPAIRGNTVGSDRAGTVGIGNRLHGISIEPGVSAGPVEAQITGNRVGGEPGNAIGLLGGRDHVVRGNVVGVGPTGIALAGDGNGIAVYDVPGVTIGGPAEADGNTVAAMGASGIVVAGRKATGARVEGNRVGFDEHGESRQAYGSEVGILVEEFPSLGAPSGVQLGGDAAGSGNFVGNNATGIRVEGPAANTLVRRNTIGIGPRGGPAPNTLGVRVDRAPGTVVGGLDGGNMIAANHQGGLLISGRADGRRVQSNQIGMAPLGSQTLANGAYGLKLEEAFDVLVGVPADRVLSSDCSSGECNVFGPNNGPAIAIEGNGTRNALRGNRFTHASEQAIDLGHDGPSPIDERDLDEGPNRRINAPAGVQEAFDPRSGRYFVTGVLESSEPTQVVVEVYGQGIDGAAGTDATLLGNVRADRRGFFRFALPTGRRFARYTALTQSWFGTSEFSRGCGFRAGPAGDADRDGICDEWERQGIDYDQDGDSDLTLPGASTAKRDLYVELDAMEAVPGRQDPRPETASLAVLSTAFNQAPDGGVALHWMGSGPNRMLDERVPAVAAIDAGRTMPGSADDIADYRYGTDAEACDGTFGSAADRNDDDGRCFARLGARGLAVRYVLSAYELPAPGGRLKGAAPDDRMIALGIAATSDEDIVTGAAGDRFCLTVRGCFTSDFSYLLMHELGHTLGLAHSGESAEPADNPAHLSVMSYAYAYASSLNPLDFARTDGIRLDESEIDEARPFTLSETDLARGWRPALTALRNGSCTQIVPERDRWTSLDDDPRLQTIVHGVNDHGGRSCLRPFPGQREQLEGSEEWSGLRFSPHVGEDRFDDGAGLTDAQRSGSRERFDVVDPANATADRDDDGVPVGQDVCPGRADPDQADADRDGVGDACVADYVPSDLELTLDAPRRLTAGEEAEVVVRAREAWPLATGGATVAVELPDEIELVGHAGDGAYDAATGRWSTGAFAGHETRALRLRVRTNDGDGGSVPVAAELVQAAAQDADSTPGNGDPEEDDQAQRIVELVPPGPDPQVDLADATVREGTRSTRTLVFEVALGDRTRGSIALRARTADGTALAGEDYEPLDARLTIPDGSDSFAVRVPVRTDGRDEPAETLTLTLSEVDGARSGRLTATGTIVDDDQPARPGELVTFGCIAKPSMRDRCDTEVVGLNAEPGELALAGGENLYVESGPSIVHVRRDPRTETLTPGRCWRVTTKGPDEVGRTGCEDFARVDGGFPIETGYVMRMAASPDGRRLYALLHASATGGGTAVASFAVDPADGALTLERCIGDPAVGPACDGGSLGVRNAWSALAVDPGGRQLYVVSDDELRLIRLDAQGVPLAFTCADTGSTPTGGSCGPLLDPSNWVAAEVAPDGSALAVRGEGRVTVFRRDPASGTLGERRQLAFSAASLTWSPDSRLLYVTGGAMIQWVDVATMEVRGCVQGNGGGVAKCPAEVAASLHYPGVIRVAPDGRDVYVAVEYGGVVAVPRAADGSLGGGGRCGEPEEDRGPCAGEGSTVPFFDRTSALLIDPQGTTVFAAGEAGVNRYLRVQPPAPEGNRAPFCSDASVLAHPGQESRLRLACADLDGDPVTVRVTAPPQHGVLGALDPLAGELPYTPAADYRGSDELRFRGNDGRADSADATVRLTSGNTVPTCETDHGVPRVRPGRSVDLVVRCRDADGDPLRTEVVDGPREGSLDGLRYTARAGWTGEDVVRVRATDGWDASAPVELRVAVAVSAPYCHSTTTELLRVRGGATAERRVTCFDADADSAVRVSLAGQSGSYGSATLRDGMLRYTARRWSGSDTIRLRAVDDDGLSATAEIPVQVDGETRSSPSRGGGSGGGRECRGSSCRPDSGGEMTFRYLCRGREVATPGMCSGEVVIIACDRSGCRFARGAATAGTAAARGKVLPGVRGRRLAQGRATAKPGQTANVRVRLSRAALRELRRRGQMRVVVVVRVRQADGTARTERRSVLLKAPLKQRPPAGGRGRARGGGRGRGGARARRPQRR